LNIFNCLVFILAVCNLDAGEMDVSVALLSKQLSSGNTEQRSSAAEKLGRLGPTAAPAVPELIRAARAYLGFEVRHAMELTPDKKDDQQFKTVRDKLAALYGLHGYAVQTLGMIGPSADIAIPMLLDELMGPMGEGGDNHEIAIKKIAPSVSEMVNEFHALKQLRNLVFAQKIYSVDRARRGLSPKFSSSIGGEHGFLNDSADHVAAEGVPGKATPLHGYLFRVVSIRTIDANLHMQVAKADDDMRSRFGLIAYPNAYGKDGRYIYAAIASRDDVGFRAMRKDFKDQTVIGDDWGGDLDESWTETSAERIAARIREAATRIPPMRSVDGTDTR
jgi:hypothetical protein